MHFDLLAMNREDVELKEQLKIQKVKMESKVAYTRKAMGLQDGFIPYFPKLIGIFSLEDSVTQFNY